MNEWNLASAQKACEAGQIQSWIEEYLQVPEWENLGLLRRVRDYSTRWLEPSLVEISKLERIAGPGPEYRFPQDPDLWSQDVSVITRSNPDSSDLPPIIAWQELDGAINVADGNHRISALETMGKSHVWALVHDGPLRSKEEIEARIARFNTQNTNKE